MKKRRTFIFHMLTITVLLILLITGTIISSQKNIAVEKQHVETLLNSYKDSIVLNFTNKFNYTEELSSVLISDGDTESFEDVAKQILAKKECLSVELLEKTKLVKVYPSGSASDQYLGKDISELDYAYTQARVNNDLVVEGPMERNGKTVFLVIKPLFTTDDNGTSIFRGEIAIEIDSETLINSFNLNTLKEKNYDYELWRVHPKDGHKDVVAISSKTADFSRSLETTFNLPTTWTLSIIKSGGWINLPMLITLISVTIILTLLVALFLFCYRQKADLKESIRIDNLRDADFKILNRDSFLRNLLPWTAEKDRCFHMVYIVIHNYNRIVQICTEEQKVALIEYLNECFRPYFKKNDAGHLIGRVGESNFVIAIHEDMKEQEIINLQKRLALELLYKIDINGTREFLTAECSYCSFPKDGATPKELLDFVTATYFNRLSAKNAPHMMADRVDYMMTTNPDISFGEYSDIEMNHLSKTLNRYRTFLQNQDKK
ncbi:MAG: hypothetical protein RR073_03470 [Clostridia bacterium]